MHGSHHQPRPASEQVQDLHVYVIPPELWRQNLRSAANEVIADSISLGFLRLPPQTYLSEIRQEIVVQLGDDYLPKDYTFLKSVGRCLTQVKGRQERELKAKHFIPPYAYAPELFILDAHAESMRDSPSTIYPQSLNGTALPRTGSKTDSGYSRDPSDRGGNNQYPNSKYDVTPPVPSSNTPRHMQQSQYPASDNQTFDHQNAHLKSSYPTYSQPYSHDISALTNAHRNQVDDSHRPRYDQGDGTYRKYNDDSSGYRSMPSPTKVSESSPTRVRGGDNSRSPRPEERNSNGYASPSRKPNHSSPQKLDRTDTEILSEPVTSRTEKQGYNGNVDNDRSPHRRAGSTERDGEGRRSHEREMMSATPTAGKQVNRSMDLSQTQHEDNSRMKASSLAPAGYGHPQNPSVSNHAQYVGGYSAIPPAANVSHPRDGNAQNLLDRVTPTQQNGVIPHIQVGHGPAQTQAGYVYDAQGRVTPTHQNGTIPLNHNGHSAAQIQAGSASNAHNRSTPIHQNGIIPHIQAGHGPAQTYAGNASNVQDRGTPTQQNGTIPPIHVEHGPAHTQAGNAQDRVTPTQQNGIIPKIGLHGEQSRPDGYDDDSTDPRRSVSGREHDNLSEERLALLRELEKARDARLYSERKREELVKKARAMQAKTNNRRNQAREVWKKRYYEAKKQTPALESDCQKVRTDLDSLHKKYLSALESSKSNVKQKENHQLDAAKLQYEVDELQRRADAAKMKLTAEMKLRNQAETELRALRAELTQKKMNMNLSRSQKMNSIGNSIGQSGATYAGRGQPIASK